MQVVEHQHERLALGQQREQLADRLVRAVALVRQRDPARERARRAGRARARSSSSPSGASTAGGSPRTYSSSASTKTQNGRSRSSSDALPDEHEAAARVGDRLELGEQPGLADPGLADDLQRSGAAPLERRVERAQLLFAPDELLGKVRHGGPRRDPTYAVNSIPWASASAITSAGSSATARKKRSISVPGEKTT